MSSMLHEVGIVSYYVSINTARGSVTPDVIVAIKLPDAVDDPSLVATMRDPKLGQLLFFDPTDELTPFGQIAGNLQANYGLLVTQWRRIGRPTHAALGHEWHSTEGQAGAGCGGQSEGGCQRGPRR